MDADERLVNLESALAFQERLVSELNDVVTRQQDQIDRLVREVEQLREQLTPGVRDAADEEPPPHY